MSVNCLFCTLHAVIYRSAEGGLMLTHINGGEGGGGKTEKGASIMKKKAKCMCEQLSSLGDVVFVAAAVVAAPWQL